MHRRHFIVLSLACPLACLLPFPAAATEPELSRDSVHVVYENEMYVGRFTFHVPVPPAVAWEALTDFERMVGVVPNLESSRILSRESNVVLVAQKGRLDYGPFSFAFESERRVEMHPKEGLLVSRAVSGTAKHMASEMKVIPDAAGTRLEYRLEMIPNRWFPSSVGIGFMRSELAEQFTALAREMVRRHQRKQSA